MFMYIHMHVYTHIDRWINPRYVVTKQVKGRVGNKGRGEAGWAGGSEVKGLVGLSG